MYRKVYSVAWLLNRRDRQWQELTGSGVEKCEPDSPTRAIGDRGSYERPFNKGDPSRRLVAPEGSHLTGCLLPAHRLKCPDKADLGVKGDGEHIVAVAKGNHQARGEITYRLPAREDR